MGAHACAELVLKLLFDELAVRHDGGRLPHRLLEERRAESIPALMETDQMAIVLCAQLRDRILLPTGCPRWVLMRVVSASLGLNTTHEHAKIKENIRLYHF